MSDRREKLVLRLCDVPPGAIEWLWPGRLAAGKLALIDGDPSQGKSLMTLDLAARFTTGAALPDGHTPPGPLSVVLIGSEDGVQDTVLPRLAAAGANLRRAHAFRGRLRHGELDALPVFPDDCDLLRETLRETGARLVVADPLMSFLNASFASINDQMVRQALAPVAAVAEECRAAVLLVRHLNKGGQGQKAIYRGSGSIGIIGAARTAFLVGGDPEDPDLRVLACTKNNLAAFPPSLAYRIATTADGQPVIRWEGTTEVAADELVGAAPRKKGEALHHAEDFLHGLLAKGACTADVVLRKARGANLAERTLNRAKAQLGVVSREVRRDGKNVWFWHLPEGPFPLPDDDEVRRGLYDDLPPLPRD